jgi:hypothetical protein
MAYAKGTSVSVEKSRAEIESLIIRRGAEEYTSGLRADKALIQFKLRDRVVRFVLPLPQATDKGFQRKKRRSYTVTTSESERQAMAEQASREKWRALRIAILAKLESIESGIEQFEEAFFSQIVDPATNRTLYETFQEPLALAYANQDGRPLRLPSQDEIEGEVRSKV